MGRLSAIVFATIGLSLYWAAGISAQAYAHPCAKHTQTGLNECAWQKYRAADAEMNRVYRSSLAADSSCAMLLEGAQRAWVVFRDSQCAYVARAYEGGSMQSMQQGACLEALTRARTKELREITKW
jgi:uncharacterized protein YecT (DUF1311 family)